MADTTVKPIPYPQSGQRLWLDFVVMIGDTKDKHEYVLPVADLSFSKDITSAVGDGTLHMPNMVSLYKTLHVGQEFLIRAEWGAINTKPKVKEILSGTVESVKRNNLLLEVNFKDNGKLLEAQASVSFTQEKRSVIIRKVIEQAGLKAVINFGDQPDDKIDYSTATATAGTTPTSGANGIQGSCICVNSILSTGCQPGATYKPWEYHCWVNKCVCCGKTTLRISTKRCPECANNQLNCANCDCDYCGKTGWELSGKCNKRLTPCSTTPAVDAGGAGFPTIGISGGHIVGYNMPVKYPTIGISGGHLVGYNFPTSKTTPKTGGTASPGTATGSSPTTTVGGDALASDATTTSSNKSYWDMLTDLCDPLKVDLQFFVWIDTCFVQAIPSEENAVLQIDDYYNVVKDSVTITSAIKPDEGTSTPNDTPVTPATQPKSGEFVTDTTQTPTQTVNLVVVNYGKGALPKHVSAVDADSVQMFGEQMMKYDKLNFNQEQAQAYANKMLNKLNRENGFSIDLTVTGHPEWFIGRWAKTKLERYNYQDTLYIQIVKFNLQSGVETPKYDLKLVDYFPIINAAGSPGKGATATNGNWQNVPNSGSAVTIAKQLGTPSNIWHWIKANVKYQFYYNHRRDPDQVIRDRLGNCYDQADLSAVMYNAIGLKASRECGHNCSGYAHCVCIVYINGKRYISDTVNCNNSQNQIT
jgi:Transglutaminase-like superfamily